MSKNETKEELFERKPIPLAVASLSIPTVIGSLVAILYNLADTYFVGMLNLPVETAAVTLAAPVILAFNAVNNLFGVGGSSMMSRALGRKDLETVKRSSAFSFYGALVCGALFSLGCIVFNAPLLKILGADAVTTEATREYLMWTVCVGAVPSILNVVMGYLVRSEGAALHASIGTMSGCLMNIVLDPIFILPSGLNMGSAGAGLATFISNCFALLYFCVYLIVKRKSTCISVSPRHMTLNGTIVGGVFAVGVPAMIQNLLNVVGGTVLNNLAAPYQAEALAAMGICTKINMVPMYLAMGMTQGVMPLISYNYASGDRKRMKHAMTFTLVISESVLVMTALGMFFFADGLMHAFIEDAATVAYGIVFLRSYCFVQPLLAMDFFAVHVFQAIGYGVQSLIFAILRKPVLEIPLMYALNAAFPLYGLPYAQVIAEAVMAVAAGITLVVLLKKLDAKSSGAKSVSYETSV